MTGSDVGGDAVKHAGVARTFDARDAQIAVLHETSRVVAHALIVERPAEHDMLPIADVTVQRDVTALDGVLIERRWIEVELLRQ